MSTTQAPADVDGPDGAATSPGAVVAEELGHLARLIQSLKSHSAPAPRGLEWSTYMVLLHLVKHGPQRSGSLADLLHSDPSTVSRQASALVDLGLVDRETDPADRRAVRLAATAQGRQLFDEARAQRIRVLDGVMSDWPHADAQALAELMRRFNRDLEAHLVATTGHTSIGHPGPHPHAPATDASHTTATPSTQEQT